MKREQEPVGRLVRWFMFTGFCWVLFMVAGFCVIGVGITMVLGVGIVPWYVALMGFPVTYVGMLMVSVSWDKDLGYVD